MSPAQAKEMDCPSLAIDPEDAHALTGDAQYRTLSGDLDGALESSERA